MQEIPSPPHRPDATSPPPFTEAAGPSRPTAPANVTNSQQARNDGIEMQDIPPPSFTPYHAEYSFHGGDIVSHDHHLNEDGEALYRFLLSQAFQKPELLLHCRGTHPERRTRPVTGSSNGVTTISLQSYTKTVVDFDFYIDASSAILSEQQDTPVIWTVGDLDPAYRGKMVKEVDSSPLKPNDIETGDAKTAVAHLPAGLLAWWKRGRRKATKAERKQASTWRRRQVDVGFPPWIRVGGQASGTEAAVESVEDRSRLHGTFLYADNAWYYNTDRIQAPSKLLREWADEYCASNMILKQFTFQKTLYGWNMEALKSSVEGALKNLGHHEPTVEFYLNGSKISVRPDTGLSRALSKLWVRVLLWMTLIFPLCIWPFKRFHSRGGGEWRVCGSAFALVKWRHLEDSIPGETVHQYLARTSPRASGFAPPSSIYQWGRERVLWTTERGISELIGTREEEWLRQWEGTIVSLASARCQDTSPVRVPR